MNRASQSSALAQITLNNCDFSRNQAMTDDGYAAGVIESYASYSSARAYLTMTNCFVTDNLIDINDGSSTNSGFIYNDAFFDSSESHATMINCTIADNNAVVNSGFTTVSGVHNDDGWSGGDPIFTIKNTILTGHFNENAVTWISQDSQGIFEANSNYNFIENGERDSSNLINGIGSIYGTFESSVDPCFIGPASGDYHLQSQAGRWDPNISQWVIDPNMSICIDAGDPNSNWTKELWPHGKRINMGAFGGTAQASMSLSTAGNAADLSNNDIVNFIDLAMLANKWSSQEVLLSEDIDRNQIVNFIDLSDFINEWLWEE